MKLNTALVVALGTFLVAPLSFTSAASSGKGAFDVKKAAREIDALVEAGLNKHDLKPNAEINDETFVRRAYLDIAGRIPTIEEAEKFHASTDDRKREQLIADLLESDGAVSHGTQRMLNGYLKKSNYEQCIERLGLTDKEFRALAKKSLEAKESYLLDTLAVEQADNALYGPLRFVHTVEMKRTLNLPHDYQYDDAKPNDPVSASTMFGGEIDLENIDDSTIDAYTEWMTARDNPTFTKVIANRLWKRVFGHGVFEPLDDLTDHTYVPNPKLLAYIEEMMRTVDYDMRKYMEVLYNTKSYQRAANGEELFPGAPYRFAGPTLRRMSAEQIWDSIVALALPEADRYRPRLKSQLASIEQVRKLNEVIASRSVEDYIAMVEEIATEFKKLKPKQKTLRVQMSAARNAGDKDLYKKLNKEYYDVRGQSGQVVADIGYRNVGDNVKGDDLLIAMGMSEVTMQMNGGMRSAVAPGERAVLTKLPTPEMPEPPADLDRKKKNDWLRRQKKAYRDYTELVSGMARASELESPAGRGHFLREFGQSDREVIENAADHASVPQALNLLNGTIAEALTNQFAVFGSRVHQAGDAEEKIDMIFQAMLTREPTASERELALRKVEQQGDSAYQRIVRALLNTQQFIFVQ